MSVPPKIDLPNELPQLRQRAKELSKEEHTVENIVEILKEEFSGYAPSITVKTVLDILNSNNTPSLNP